ncbi:hypothetical protein KEP72_24090 [Escherichia coli]|nr:hypothetical protein [Escherichia coli]
MSDVSVWGSIFGSGKALLILLAPEVSAPLHYVPDLRRKMLLATLWNIGGSRTHPATDCHPR